LPALGFAEGSIAPQAAVALVAGTALFALAAVGLGMWGLQRWRAGRLGGGMLRWLYRLPGVGELLAQQQSLHYFTGLERGLAAGLPLAQSLRLATAALPSTPRRAAFE